MLMLKSSGFFCGWNFFDFTNIVFKLIAFGYRVGNGFISEDIGRKLFSNKVPARSSRCQARFQGCCTPSRVSIRGVNLQYVFDDVGWHSICKHAATVIHAFCVSHVTYMHINIQYFKLLQPAFHTKHCKVGV